MISVLEKQIIVEKIGFWMDQNETDGLAIYEPPCFSHATFRIDRTSDYIYMVVNKMYKGDIEISRQNRILAFISNNRPVFMTHSLIDVIEKLEHSEGENSLKVWFLDSLWG